MSNCIKFDELAGVLELLDTKKNVKDVEDYYHKPFRYETKDITPNVIWDTLVNGKDPMVGEESISERMVNKFYKLYPTREALAYEDASSAIPDTFSRGDKTVSHSLGLVEVMDAIKGEVHKAAKYNLDVINITNGRSPTTPTARVSAVIGRALLAKNGIKLGTHAKARLSPIQVEKAYSTIGMNVLEDLAKDGFLTIEEGSVINDFVDKSTGMTPAGNTSKNAITEDKFMSAKVVSLNLEDTGAFVKLYGEHSVLSLSDTLFSTKSDYISEGLTFDYNNIVSHTGKEQVVKKINPVRAKQLRNMKALFAFVGGVKQMVVPTTIVPMAIEPETGNASGRDTQTPTGTIEAGREILNNTPMYYKTEMRSFLELFSKEFKASKKSLPAYIKSILGQSDKQNILFGLESSDVAPSLSKESIRGKNISLMNVLEDTLQFWDSSIDETTPQYTSSFQGANIRLYYENTLGNVQTSKFSRDVMTTTKKDSRRININTEPKAYQHLISHLKDDSGYSEDEILGSSKDEVLEDAIKQYNIFKTSDDLITKLNAIGTVNRLLYPEYDSIKKPSFLKNMSVLGGIIDVREGLKTGEINTQFMTSPDATANGATLNLGDALGSNPKLVTLLQNMGVLKKDGKRVVGASALSDVYEHIENLIRKALDKNNFIKNAGKQAPLLQAIVDGVYRENIRNLAKAPTTTLIYGQGKNAAINSIAKDIAEAIGIALHRGTQSKKGKVKDSIKELAKELGIDLQTLTHITPDTVKDIKTILAKKDGIASILQDLMNKEFGEGLLEEYSNTSDKVYEVLHDTWKKSKEGSKFKAKTKELASKIYEAKKASKPEDVDVYQAELDTLRALAKHLKLFTADSFLNETMDANTLAKSGIALEKTRNVYNAKENVVTMERFPTKTVWNVTPTHAQDAYSKTKSDIEAKKTVGKDYAGNMNIHDMTMGHPIDTQASKAPYVESMKEMFTEYSKLQAGLASARVYLDIMFEKGENPSLEKAIVNLEDQVAEYLDNRQEILNDNNTEFITEDSTLFGEDDSVVTVPDTKVIKNVKPSKENYTSKGIKNPKLKKIAALALETNPDVTTVTGDKTSYDLATNTITLAKDATDEQRVHELVHAATAQKIVNDSKYANKVQKIYSKVLKENPSLLTNIESMPKEERLHEFMALGITNDTFINGLKGTKSLGTKILGFIRKLLAETFGMTTTELDNAYGDTLAVFNQSKYDSKLSNKDLTLNYPKGSASLDGMVANKVTQLNLAIYSMLLSKAEDKVQSLSVSADKILADKFPLYKTLKDRAIGIFGPMDILQQMLHYTHTSDFKGADVKNELLSHAQRIESDQNSRDNKLTHKMHQLTKKFNKEEKSTLFNIVSKVPMADYYKYSPETKTVEQVEDRIEELEFNLKDRDVAQANAQVAMYMKGEINHRTVYNLDTKYSDGKVGDLVRELTALKAIEYLGTDKVINILKGNSELGNIIQDNVLALDSTYREFGEDFAKASSVKGTLVGEYYKGNVQTKAISLADRRRYSYEEGSGWKVLREPTEHEAGAVYRVLADTSFSKGMGTDIGYLQTDLYVPKGKVGKGNTVLNTGTKSKPNYKIIFTPEEKATMGLIEDASHTLIKSTSHMIAAHESEIIRNALTTAAMTSEITSDDDTIGINAVKERIADKVIDHPWFIKLGDGVRFDKLDKEIRDKYKPIQKKMSEIRGFDEKVSLVRKDIAPWLVGKSNNVLANYPKLQQISRVTKRLVSMKKLGQVIANPIKIAKDLESNQMYLATMGVPASFMLKVGKDITEEYDDLNEARAKTASLRVKHIAYPKDAKIQKEYNDSKQEMQDIELYGAVERGFINSLSSDIINNNLDTTEGLQADINEALSYILKNDKDTYNKLGVVIGKFSQLGFNAEGLLEYLGGIMNKTKAGSVGGKMLQNAARNITANKTDGDIISYVSQFLLAPNAETIKAGIVANDLADIIAKETYFRWLRSQDVSDKEATQKVITEFPDFKENLPLKDLSDYGILMYPSFWTRIQKPIYRMAVRRPLNTLIGLGIEDAFDTDIETIGDANAYTKITAWGGLIKNPYEGLKFTPWN